jgi:hypothetical protein
MISMSASKAFLEPQLVLRALTVHGSNQAKAQAAWARVSLLGVSALYSTDPKAQSLPLLGGDPYEVSIDGITDRFFVYDREGALDTGIGPNPLLDMIMLNLGMTNEEQVVFHKINQKSHVKAHRYLQQFMKHTERAFSPNLLSSGSRQVRLNFDTASDELLKLLSKSGPSRLEMKSDIGISYFYTGRIERLGISAVN